MFSNISWTAFLTALAIVAIIYYAVIGALFYRNEILLLIAKLSKKEPQIFPASDNTQEQPREFTNLMGASRVQSVNAYTQVAPNFLVKEQSVNHQGSSDIDLIGSISDLMEGIKTLFRAIKEDGKGKEDIKALLPTLLADHSAIAASRYRYSINTFIHELCTTDCGLDFSVNEINDLWP